MDTLADLEGFRRFASSCANVRVTAGGVTFHWLDWYLRIWEDRGTTFVASARRGSEPIVECYGSEELVWKWGLTRIGAYTRYCLRYPAITPPLTNDALPTGVHLTGHGLKLDIAPGIPAFLNTDTDTLISAYMSPTGGPLHDLTDFKTWETDPMGKGFFPNLETLVNWHEPGRGRSVLRDVCGFALNEHNTPIVTDYLFSAPPEVTKYLHYNGDTYRFETSSRGGTRTPNFWSPDFITFTRLVLLNEGGIIRNYLNYLPLSFPCGNDQLAPGWQLVNDRIHHSYGLQSPEEAFLPVVSSDFDRIRLSHTATFSLEELFQAFTDPWGGMLAHHRDEEYWERAMRPRLSGMKPYSDYDLSSYDAFIASHPWYTAN